VPGRDLPDGDLDRLGVAAMAVQEQDPSEAVADQALAELDQHRSASRTFT
jgi:hypothetical protein